MPNPSCFGLGFFRLDRRGLLGPEPIVDPLEDVVVVTEATLPFPATDGERAYGFPLASVIETLPLLLFLRSRNPGLLNVVAASPVGSLTDFVGSPPILLEKSMSYRESTKSMKLSTISIIWKKK